MRKTRLLSLLFVLALTCGILLATVPLQADAANEASGTCGENVTWCFDSETRTLTISGSGAMQDYTSTEGPWVSLRTKVTKVVIEEGVTSIGDFAFYYFSSMRSLTIPEGVTSIGRSAVCDCSMLASVKLPESLTSIGLWAFGSCTSLTSITIPSGLTSISSHAFYYCTSLKNITISEGVQSIGDNAFGYCRPMTSIIIPKSVTSIGDYAFTYCSSLTSIIIPKEVASMGEDVFTCCSALTDIYCVAESKPTDWPYIWQGDFNYATVHWGYNPDYEYIITDGKATITKYIGAGGDIVIPSMLGGCPVTAIGERAFISCKTIASVVIPEGVTSIGQNAFNGSTLTSISIPASVTYIAADLNFANGALSCCSALESILVAESNPIYYVENNCLIDRQTKALLAGCKNSVIPSDVTRIAHGAFQGCSALTSIVIPAGVTSIDSYAFDGCTALESIEIPDSVTSLGYKTFFCCSALQSIDLPDGLTALPQYVLYGCKSLTSLTIPDSVTLIGEYALTACRELTSIVIPESVTAIDSYAFQSCTALSDITITSGLTRIGQYAFTGCDSLLTIAIPKNVENVGNGIFYDCESLKDIYCEAASKPENWSDTWVGSYCTATVHWGYKAKENDLKFTGASLTLQESLTINFKIDATLFGEGGYTNPYVKFVLNGVETIIRTYSEQDGMYVFNFVNILPDQMSDAITATLYATQNGEVCEGETKEYSVVKYCHAVLDAYSDDQYAELRTLIVDLLNYGTATQLYTNYNVASLANAALTDLQKSWGTTTARETLSIKNAQHGTIDNPSIKFIGVGLNLMESIAVRFTIDAETVDGLTAKLSCGGSTWSVTEFSKDSEGRYVFLAKLNAAYMSDPIVATVYQNGNAVSNSLCYSIESYANECVAYDQSKTLADLVDAMIRYGDSAKEYVN